MIFFENQNLRKSENQNKKNSEMISEFFLLPTL